MRNFISTLVATRGEKNPTFAPVCDFLLGFLCACEASRAAFLSDSKEPWKERYVLGISWWLRFSPCPKENLVLWEKILNMSKQSNELRITSCSEGMWQRCFSFGCVKVKKGWCIFQWVERKNKYSSLEITDAGLLTGDWNKDFGSLHARE